MYFSFIDIVHKCSFGVSDEMPYFSLIDQWKAAKEELEDEEEPENAYEILERKREREIKVKF